MSHLKRFLDTASHTSFAEENSFSDPVALPGPSEENIVHLDELNLEELGLGLPPIEVTTTTSPQNTIACVYDSDVKVANNPDEILDKAYSGVWAKYEDDKPMPKNVQVDAQKVINAYAEIKPTIFNAMLSKEIPKVNQIEFDI